jgi:hypothetical protein
MRNLIEDRRVLRMQFEAFAHYARHESERPESAYCFDALATSVDDVSPELLQAYVEMFQKIEHRKVGSALKQSIQQGLWSPTDATEYGALHCVCIWNRSAFLSHALTATARSPMSGCIFAQLNPPPREAENEDRGR